MGLFNVVISDSELARFTRDRLVGIINRLGPRVEVKLKVKRAPRSALAAVA
jgi:hypothetical protein